MRTANLRKISIVPLMAVSNSNAMTIKFTMSNTTSARTAMNHALSVQSLTRKHPVQNVQIKGNPRMENVLLLQQTLSISWEVLH